MTKELKALEKLGRLSLYEIYDYLQVNETEEFNIIKNYILKAQKLEKAINFIKEHCSITKVNDTLTIIELGKYYIGKGSDEDMQNLLEVLENE